MQQIIINLTDESKQELLLEILAGLEFIEFKVMPNGKILNDKKSKGKPKSKKIAASDEAKRRQIESASAELKKKIFGEQTDLEAANPSSSKDFFEFVGMWADKEIDATELRKKAWARNL